MQEGQFVLFVGNLIVNVTVEKNRKLFTLPDILKNGDENMLHLDKDIPVKINSDIKIAKAGLKWNADKIDGVAVDLDLFALGLDSNDKASDDSFCYFGTPHGIKINDSPYKAVLGDTICVSKDDLTGADVEGDYNENSILKLNTIPENVKAVVVGVSVYKAKQHFGQVHGAYVDIMNAANEEKFAHYDLSKDMNKGNAIIVGRFDRLPTGWNFTAIGEEINGGDSKNAGMLALIKRFGLNP